MRKIKSLVLAVMGLLCSMSVSAEDFKVGGIYYYISSQADKTVAVTYRGNKYYDYSDEYSGDVKIPESVTYNGNAYSVTSIGEYAFWVCSSLISVEIPNSVTSIGDDAFSGCSSLTSVEIPNSVTSIGESAFESCSSLTSVEIPNSVTSIGWGAFKQCSSLTSVEIPNSVTSIGDYAFRDCSRLTSVEIPNSVTSIGSEAFYGTAWYYNQPNGVIYAGKALYKYKGTMPANTSIRIEDGTVSISPDAFSRCSNLTSVEIPNSVTSIGYSAFNECSRLTSVEIPNSVTNIGEYAFSYCENLKKLISYAEVPPVCGYDVFDGVNTQKCILQVPEKSISAYQQADQWKEFFLIEGVPTAIGGVTVDGAVPATADVYSTNGMLVKRNADLKNLKHELPAGIYIIGGKKVYVR